MTQAKCPDVSEMTIRMDAISSDAEQQLDELCWESQQAVLRRLFNRTIWRRDCKLVTQLSGNRVYRLRVTDSVRVCFIHFSQQHCIVNIGSKPDFEHYCNTFHGSLPNSFVPLSESTVMKNLNCRSLSVTANGHKPTPATMPHKQPLDSSPVYQEAQRISFALIELLETALEGHQSKIDDDIVAHVQLMKDEVDKHLVLLADSVKGQTIAADKADLKVAEINDRMTAMHQKIKCQSAELAQLVEKLAAAEQADLHGWKEQQAAMEAIQLLTKRLTQRMDQLAGTLGNLRRELTGHHEQVAKYIDIFSARIESVEHSVSSSETSIGLLELLTAERFAVIDVHMNEGASVASILDRRVTALETVVQTLEVEAFRPSKSWRATLALFRQWKDCFSDVMRRLLKRVPIGKTGPRPLETPIELRRLR